MDLRQVAELLQLNLANAAYGDNGANKILTGAVISKQDLGAFLSDWNSTAKKNCPFAVLRVTGGPLERELATHASGSMGRGARQYMRALVAVVAGSIADPIPSPPPFVTVGNVVGDDVHGQGAVIGKSVTLGGQAGQGVDRLVPELIRQALGDGLLVDAIHGVQGRVVAVRDLEEVYGFQLLGRRIELEISNGSVQQSYHAPYQVKLTNVGTTVTVAWKAVPTRPDFIQYVLSRNNVPVYSGTATTFVDATGAHATYTYSLQATYDDTGRPPVSNNRQSAAVVGQITV